VADSTMVFQSAHFIVGRVTAPAIKKGGAVESLINKARRMRYRLSALHLVATHRVDKIL